MRVLAFRREHLRDLPTTPWVEGMEGLSIRDREGRILSSMGTMSCEWGPELWIVVRPGLQLHHRILVARVMRWYMGVLLGEHEILYTHAPHGYAHERLFRWLGLEPTGEIAGNVRWEATCQQASA
jgi:hypothetical protein